MIEDQRQMSWCRWSEGGGTSDRLEEEVVYCEQSFVKMGKWSDEEQ